ncbi:hypothetical protein AFK68_12035 [Hydrocoleum sp. CS-953]|uniref:WD40 repeat domain-containing protein n=1 Tax=Hydrocoleum sp. CS-953 TaxID=1671698 RepID=UPI000B9AF347|nr:hypothetical protein [Hydrocoleum sp. CS-953]OZH54263.1 hypothetical protein AFK68_12035 [Hydrocoleum sp. CS-953]
MVAAKKSKQNSPFFNNTYTVIGLIVLGSIGAFWFSRSRLVSVKNPVSDVAQQTVPEQILAKHKSWVYTVDISPDGQTIASGSYDGTIKISNVSNGELLHKINAHDGDKLPGGMKT